MFPSHAGKTADKNSLSCERESRNSSVGLIKNWKVEGENPSTFQTIQFVQWLFPLALYRDGVYLDVQHNETPQLIKLVVHPELFRSRESLCEEPEQALIRGACSGPIRLVDQCLLVRGDALAEHVIRPALIGKHDGDEDQCDNGHDCQRIL